ncbi:amino-acid permease BAT1-like [Phalaenopsis equestris]|uniref:amino-acid permease BAT1-like n=1 Tax=Phalaenopsis equestris TaxID=78828 RepID=UPI0009E6518B|nr:amino-acid permease BAT1-like [Phalaenopsis equestris]
MDSGEKRLNELGYKQELRREMTLFKSLAITFSTVTMFAGIPLYGPSLLYAGPASLVWGWLLVSFFTCFVGLALAEICSSFPVRLRNPLHSAAAFFDIRYKIVVCRIGLKFFSGDAAYLHIA